MSALDRILKAVHAGWADYNQSDEASTEAQARFARRIGKNDIIHLEGEDWKIVSVNKGDDKAPVIIENGKVHRTIASLDLERVEIAARLIRSVDVPPERPEPAVVPTGAPRRPAPTPVVVELEDEEVEKPVAKKGVPLKLRYGAVDVSEAVEDRARDTAEESLHAEKRDAGFFAKIFKHNIAYEVYRQIAISRSRSKILNEKNLYASDNFDRDAHRKATGAVVDRFLIEHDDFLHGEGKTAEKKKVFGDSPEEKAVKKDLEALVREYATNPEMDAEELAARKDAIFASANKLAGDAKGRGVMYADNLDKIAEQVRQQAAHAGGIANLDLDLEITLGRAKLGARTERDRNLLDRALDGLQRYSMSGRVGSGILNAMHNEVVVALSTAYVVGGLIGRAKAGAAALATFGTSMLVTGAYSAYKEKSRLGRERSLHERQMALGGETKNDDRAAVESELLRKKASLKWWNVMERHAIDKELEELKNGREIQPRRAEMEKFALARESAKGLAESVRGFLSADGKELRGDVSVANAASVLADIEARIRVSDREKIDLLKYTSVAEAEAERLNLDVARASLKAALRKAHDGAFSTTDKKEYANFQEYYNEVYKLREGALYGKESAAQKQHRAFSDWSTRQALKRGASTMLIGAVVGTVGHDLWALGTGGGANDTTLGSAWHALMGYFNHASAAVGSPNVEAIGGGTFTTPAGTDLVPQADGSFVLESVADHHAIASGLHIDASGHLDAASEATLRSAGANIVESDTAVSSTATTSSTESAWDWLRHHAMQKIHRDHWMDNDTPMHFSEDLKRWLGADYNELKLEWGGVMGPDGVHPMGLDSHGQIVMTMGHMTPDGSWHDGLTENAPAEIVERKVRLLLTMNDHSQNSAIEILSDQHGQFHIDPNSDIGKTFFRIDHGKVVPLYHTAEVGISKGFTGRVNHFNILATAQGAGVHSGITSTELPECIDQHVTTIDLPNREVPPIAVPWFVPIRGRQPMEPLKKGGRRIITPPPPPPPPGDGEGEPLPPRGRARDGAGYYYGAEGHDYGLLPREKYNERIVGGLRNDAEYDTAEHENELIDAYLAKQPNAYMAELERLVASAPEMKKEVDLVITAPAYGEGKNIEATIRNYAKMKDRHRFEIVIFENHPVSKERDETSKVLERMRSEFPDMNIVHLYKEFDVKEPIGKIRKYLVDSVLLRKQKAGIQHSIAIASNDADLEDISPNYARDIATAFNEDPGLDALAARWDFPKETYKKFPLLHASQRLWHYMDIAFRHNFMKSPELIGRNSAFRAGTYAAIGGYSETSQLAEDLEIGWMIKNARKYDSSRITYLNKAKLVSNPRRAAIKMLSGGRLVQQYGDFHVNEEVRNTPLESLLDVRRDFQIEEFSKEVQAIYDHYSRWEASKGGWAPDDAVENSFARAMGFLGLKFSIDRFGEVHIVDASKLASGLEEYKDKD